MNSDISDWARWAVQNGWTVEDDASGYTKFYDSQEQYVARYPATPSNPRRRMADLKTALKRAGLAIPPPSKKEQRSQRNKDKREKEEEAK
jgi:hypothetical protein